MYCNQCFDFRKLMKVINIERFNLALSVKMNILKVLVVATFTLSAALLNQCKPNFRDGHKGSINKGLVKFSLKPY